MSEPSPKNEGVCACPNRLFGMVCCVCVCATIAYIAYLVASPPSGLPRRLWVPVLVETNGYQVTLGEIRQIQFWTPSAKTKDYLRKEGGEVGYRQKWEVLSNDDAELEFSTMLRSNRAVLGYRRVEVWGQGRTGFKPGWWWTMSVLTNYSVGDLSRTYEGFWKSGQPVYVEVVDNRGSNEQ